MDLLDTVVAIPGLANLRDLGGITTTSGKTIRMGWLYRSEVLAAEWSSDEYSKYDASHRHLYQQLGVKLVLDLRSDRESDETSSSWSQATGAHGIRFPIPEDGVGGGANYFRRVLTGEQERFDVADMSKLYCAMLDNFPRTFAAACSAIALTNAPSLVHCSAGKDRTGLLTALILELLEVDRETVVEDYALTGVTRPNRVLLYRKLLAKRGVSAVKVRVLFEAPAQAMMSALQHIDRRYGSVQAYLVDAGGFPPHEIYQLREMLLWSNSRVRAQLRWPAVDDTAVGFNMNVTKSRDPSRSAVL